MGAKLWDNQDWDRIFRNIRPSVLEWVKKTYAPSDIRKNISPREVFHDDEIEDAYQEIISDKAENV